MTAPTLDKMKFWIVVPKYSENQIKNPTFASPDGCEDWTSEGAGVTIEDSGDGARWNVYSMKVNTATGESSGAYYAGLSVENGLIYTFSCYVKGVYGQAMRVEIRQTTTVKATKQFIASGYWQRIEVSYTAPGNATDYRVYVLRDSVASTEPFYVDGAQFEQNATATTFFDGYMPGCHWTGTIRNSTSARSGNTGLGGELLCINDYAKVISVHGFGMGDWNQISTEMTSGGNMYQTHIRKNRNLSMVLVYHGDNQGDLQANRKVILDALRPDLLSNLPVHEQFGINMPSAWRGHEQRIIRYQGFDLNGVEATQPVDIVCVFLPSHSDTPSLPVFQKDVLNFNVPSGSFQGAYQEGSALELYADFPAEHIVKRDSKGNWSEFNTGTGEYDPLITGLNGTVRCMAEGPDGKIYVGGDFTNAGGDGNADYLACWNSVTESWESVGTVGKPSSPVSTILFTPEGDLVVGGVQLLRRYTLSTESPAAWYNETVGVDWDLIAVNRFVVNTDGYIYAVGMFSNAGASAYYGLCVSPYSLVGFVWNNVPWSELGLGEKFNDLLFIPTGYVVVAGKFTNLGGVSGATNIAYFSGTQVGALQALNDEVLTLAADFYGLRLYAGGKFTNAGGRPGADYIAKFSASSWAWEALGTGLNGPVSHVALSIRSGVQEVFAAGEFTMAGDLDLADRLARFVNGAWLPLDIDLPGSASAKYILPSSDGSLYIGGEFSTLSSGENSKSGVVAINLEVASASANTYPVINVSGPGTLKSIKNYRTGKSVVFNGLTLFAGEWIGLNFDPLRLSFRSGWAARGNLMNYIVAGSDYGDFYVSPGANYISLFMGDDAVEGVTKASIVWVPKFWSIEGALL